jgi:RNA polymerase sigma-70 factor (ECF subfamily)
MVARGAADAGPASDVVCPRKDRCVMSMNSKRNTPGYAALLLHRENDDASCGSLIVHGWPEQDLEDGLQEVRLKAITRFGRGLKPPEQLAEMRALCAKIAREYAIQVLRCNARRARYNVGLCESPDDYTPLIRHEQRDPVDASRQIAIVKQLFEEGVMPEHGAEILLDVASDATYPEIAQDLELTVNTVRGRMRKMRRLFEARVP